MKLQTNRAGTRKNSITRIERMIAQMTAEIVACGCSLEMGIDAAVVAPRQAKAEAKLATAQAELTEANEEN